MRTIALRSQRQILANVAKQNSVGCIVPKSLANIVENGKSYVAAGTPCIIDLENRNSPAKSPDSVSTVNAVLLHDVDVTQGNNNGTALIHGFINIEALSDEAKVSILNIKSEISSLLKFVPDIDSIADEFDTYAEFTGTQYFDTGIIPNQDTRVVMDLLFNLPLGINCGLFGSRDSVYLNAFYSFTVNGGVDLRISYGSVSYQIPVSSLPLNRTVLDFNKTVWYIDGNVVATFGYTNFTGSQTMTIASVRQEGGLTNTNAFIGKIYNYQIYQNDILVQDAVFVPQGSIKYSPVPAPSNCIWDRVSQTYITMSGTGKLNIGRVQFTTIRPEFESGGTFTGTQYFNTGIIPNQDTRVAIDCELSEGDAGLFGARTAYNVNAFGFWSQQASATYSRTDYGISSVQIPRTIAQYNTRLVIDKNKNVTTVSNGTTVSTYTNTENNFSSGVPIYIGDFNTNTSTRYGFIGKIYNYQIYQNDVLVQDAVFVPQGSIKYSPVPAPSNCIWDKVASQYILQSGTGTIGVG